MISRRFSVASSRPAPPVVQAKLMLGAPGDRYEREADLVARRVARAVTRPAGGADDGTAGFGAARPVRGRQIQRLPGADAGGAGLGPVDPSVQQAIEGARGGGQPLPDRLRQPFEDALGADFSGVRLHADARADRLARAVRAQAFTTGQDIFFRRGQYSHSDSGREVLAHELTHVVQQDGSSRGAPGGVIQRSMGFEFETKVEVRPGYFGPKQQALRDHQAQLAQHALLVQQAQQAQPGRQGRGRGRQGRGGGRQGQAGRQGQPVPPVPPMPPVLLAPHGPQGEPPEVTEQNLVGTFGQLDDEFEIYRQPGGRWKIVTDTTRMEFVTVPLNNLAELQTVADEIAQFITRLSNHPRITDVRALVNPNAWIAPPGTAANFAMHIGGGVDFSRPVSALDWYGQPQVSVGVLTHRVAKFLNLARRKQTMTGLRNQLNLMGTPGGPPEAKNEDLWQLVPENEDLGQLVANWGQTLVGGWAKRPAMREAHQLVHNHANALPQREQEKLRGLWTLMKTYWRSIVKYNPASNAYKKTHFLAMARTDFHSYYNNLAPAAQAAFLAGRGEFIQGDVAVIAGTQITLRRWYDSVINPVQGFTNGPVNAPRGVDLLSAQNSGTDEEPFATGTNKSMGQLPLDGQRAVFELRRLTPKVRIPIQFLYPHVIVPIFNLVTRAEQ